MADADAAPASPPLVLDVTVQSSRFHEAAAQTINLRGITIVVGGEGSDKAGGALTDRRELLSDADLSLATGTKYALIGRNGTGKSILLKVLASGALFDPDSQLQLRIQLVTQSFAPPPSAEWTVQDELNAPPFGYDLSEALDAGKRAQRRSELRSGRRGKEAREQALAEAGKGSGGKAHSSRRDDDDDEDADADGIDGLGRELEGASLGGVYYDVDPPAMTDMVSAFKVLDVPLSMLQKPYATLSGGWRMRITLAKSLLYKPKILLLDEPTNHLDINGINSLVSLLKSDHFAGTTVIFVSHDLYFVNEVAECVIQLQDCKLTVAKGNWDTLQRERGDRKKFTDRYAAEQEKERDRLLSSLESSMRKAGKDDKLKKQLASRKEKLLERGTGMMRDSKGHRFRKNDDENAGYHLTLLNEVEVIREEKPVRFHFDSPAVAKRGGSGSSSSAGVGAGGDGTLLAIDGLAFRYGAPLSTDSSSSAKTAVVRAPTLSGRGAKVAAAAAARAAAAAAAASSSSTAAADPSGSSGVKPTGADAAAPSSSFSLELRDLNLAAGERVVLLGPNGHGKSSLLRLIVGELTPQKGTVRIMTPQWGYFEQHAVSRLGGEKRSALQYVLDTMRGGRGGGGGGPAVSSAAGSGPAIAAVGSDIDEEGARKALGSFGLGPHALTPVALLSGGQRVALEFVIISLRKPALLLLDEPSAHLDLQAREGLARALAEFEGGGILFISHDIGFIELAQPTRALLCERGRFKPVDEDSWKRVALGL